MHTELHSIDALSGEQIELWNRLLASNLAVRSPFLSYDFCRAVHDLRGGVRVLVIRDDLNGTGFLPFQLRKGRGLLQHAEKVGGSLSDYFGIVGSLRGELNADDLLRDAHLSALRFDHAVQEMCQFPFQEAERTAGIRVHVEKPEEYFEALAAGDKFFVRTVSRSERRIGEEIGNLDFQLHTSNPAATLDHLIAAKREQYRRTGVKDGLKEEWRRRFLHRLLDEPKTSGCRPLLSTLHCGGKWVASSLNLLCNDTLHIWYPVYDTEYRRYGPGHLLFFKIIAQGTAQGIRVFDFGEGEARYKEKYRGENYELWKGVIRRGTFGGYSERILQSLSWRIDKFAARRRAVPQDTDQT
jgi:CelD/BcsL family acetyltransferase involved in cellulose biosynthesis